MKNRLIPAALATLSIVSAIAARAQAPLYFSVLNDGRGTASPVNDVAARPSDGGRVFLASPGGVAPNGNNVRILRAGDVGLIGLRDLEEIDALSWGRDKVAAPTDVNPPTFPDREILFSVDRGSIGLPGAWTPNVQSLAAAGRAAPAVFFKVPGSDQNHLAIPAVRIGLASAGAETPEDDLDAIDFRRGAVPEPPLRLYFSVGRDTRGQVGTVIRADHPYHAANIYVTDGAGNVTRFASAGDLGLEETDNVDAFALWDAAPEGQLSPGDIVWFSVDRASTGFDDVNTAATQCDQAASLFFSDFSGTNLLVKKSVELGLWHDTGACLQDELNALEVGRIRDHDGDLIPDVSDICPFIYDPDQIDLDDDGVGDVCDVCPFIYDPDQIDLDDDGVGDACEGVTGARESGGVEVRPGLRLAASSPNPFRTSTRISFSTERTARARLEIFNIAGQRVKTLVDEVIAAGGHECRWDGDSRRGKPVPPGIYYLRLSSLGESAVRKIIRLD